MLNTWLFGAPLQELTVEDLQQPGVFFQLGLPPNRVDVITEIDGVDFEEAYARKEFVVVDSLQISFISREDLISAKLAAGRPQDLVDAGMLAKKRKQDKNTK